MENFGTTKMAASQLVFTRFSQPCTFSMSSRFLLSNPASNFWSLGMVNKVKNLPRERKAGKELVRILVKFLYICAFFTKHRAW